MRTVSIRLADLDRGSIPVGFAGENQHTQVRIDCKKAYEEYPTAVVSLIVKNPHGDAYPAVTIRDGDIVSWNVTNSDLAYDGTGEIQLTFTVGEVVKKSYVGRIRIEKSILSNGEAPDPIKTWIDEANEILDEVEDAIPAGGTTGQVLAKKSDSDRDTEWVDQTGGGTSDYDELENRPQIAGVTLTGDVSLHDLGAAAESDIPDVSGFYTKPSGGIPDSDLASGVQTSLGKADSAYQKPSGGIPSSDMASAVQTSLGKADSAYQKPVSGIPAADIEEGVIPDPASIIDDTAGSGDTGKAWSADKVHGEFEGVKSDIQQKYSKPSGGIPSTDMASAVQASLAKADTALQGNDVETVVDAWLDENITNPDSPPLDRSLSSSSSAAPADMMGDLMDHESYSEGSGDSTVTYEPITPSQSVASTRCRVSSNNATISQPTTTTMTIYPVENGKTYKVVGYCDNTDNRPILIVATDIVTSGTIATSGNYEYVKGTSSTATVETYEYTNVRTGYLYINSSDSTCGVWEKVVTPASERVYYMDEIRNVNIPLFTSGLNKSVFREKIDSASALVKQVPHNAETIAKVTSVADTVTTVRSIISRNLVNKNAVDDVVIDGEGTTKTGVKTINLPCGSYYISLGGMGQYTMVKKYEHGVFSSTLYKEQFPMTLGITDPSGGYIVVYASSLSNLGDMSTLIIAKLKDGESSVSYEAYSEKTYTPTTLAINPYIQVVPNGFIEFVNSGNTAVSSTVKYLVSGQDDVSTTSKDFIVSPNGTKFLPMVKNDGTTVYARVIPKKALFIGNSLTSGWQTFGEAATDSDNDFVANFSSYISSLDNSYTFSRIWATGYEITTTLSAAQTWATNNIDPSLSSDLDLIVVQLGENVTGTETGSATFAERSAWLLQHLRETCPKARVVWMGLWLNCGRTPTLLASTKKTGCEYIDIRPLYLPANVSEIGSLYTMDADYTKSYTVDSFTVSNGQITLVFTVDGVQYTSTITSYTSYTSSGNTQISVTGTVHVVNTWYAYMHPGNEGFRKIANKMLFDLGISDSEETITA